MNKIYLLIVLFFLILQSCDCIIIINGIVIDNETKESIKDASISLLTNKFTKNDFGIIEDTIAVVEREKLISEQGNKEKWIAIGGPFMVKKAPLISDSTGFFNISWVTGFCPDYVLKIEKIGYKTLLIDNENITIDTMIFEMQKNQD